MNDYLSVVMGSLSNLNPVELEKIIEATGKHEIKLYDCRDWNSNSPIRVDATVDINQLFVNDNGDIFHNVLF